MSINEEKTTNERCDMPKYLILEKRLETFYERPIEEIYVESDQEVDVGIPVGMEQC